METITQRSANSVERLAPKLRSPIHNPRSPGVTLIELLTVILIIGLMVLVGAPILTKFGSNTRLKSAAEQVAGLLRMAKSFATTRNISCTVSIYSLDTTLPNNIFVTYIEPSDSLTKQLDKAWVAPSLVEIADVSGNSGSVQTIQFKPSGTADNASIHLIQKGTLINGNPYSSTEDYSGINSRSERVKCFTVTTDNVTGRSQIYYYGRGQRWKTTDL